jgi:uncharacterized protein YjiS (DUF1127 family)
MNAITCTADAVVGTPDTRSKLASPRARNEAVATRAPTVATTLLARLAAYVAVVRQRRRDRRAERALERLEAATLADIGAPNWMVEQARHRRQVDGAWKELARIRMGQF